MAVATILCPLDFSASTEAVFSFATDLARASGAALHLLHVCEGKPVGASPQCCLPPKALARLDDYQRQARQAGVGQVSLQVRTGVAAAEIVAEAAACLANVIVIGAHGCTNITRFLMGSTAEEVLRRAPCTALLIHYEAPALPGWPDAALSHLPPAA